MTGRDQVPTRGGRDDCKPCPIKKHHSRQDRNVPQIVVGTGGGRSPVIVSGWRSRVKTLGFYRGL